VVFLKVNMQARPPERAGWFRPAGGEHSAQPPQSEPNCGNPTGGRDEKKKKIGKKGTCRVNAAKESLKQEGYPACNARTKGGTF